MDSKKNSPTDKEHRKDKNLLRSLSTLSRGTVEEFPSEELCTQSEEFGFL